MLLDAFIKYLTFEKRYSPHTIKSYHDDIKGFMQFLEVEFEQNDLSDVKHHHARAWLIQLMDSGLKPKSINRKMGSLRSFYKYLIAREHVKTNPIERLQALKTDKRLPQFVKETDISFLDDTANFSDDFNGRRDKLLLGLLYGSGIRLSELINLKDTDINLYENTIKVLGKRNKERIIPISSLLAGEIRMYLKDKKAQQFGNLLPNLIVTNSGGACYPMWVYRKINHYLKLYTSVDKQSPHVLRHTYATHLVNNGADLNAVKDLLGHAGLAATQIYTHNSLEKLKAVFKKAHPKA